MALTTKEAEVKVLKMMVVLGKEVKVQMVPDVIQKAIADQDFMSLLLSDRAKALVGSGISTSDQAKLDGLLNLSSARDLVAAIRAFVEETRQTAPPVVEMWEVHWGIDIPRPDELT